MESSKTSVVLNTIIGKVLSIFGYTVGIFIIILICFGLKRLTEPGAAAGFTFLLIILAICILAVIKGIQIKRRLKRFKAYVGLISIDHITSLENIAGSTSQSVDFVRNDIQKMIDKKFFVNAYIDIKSNEIIVDKTKLQAFSAAASQPSYGNNTEDSESVRCPGCGAMNSKQKNVAVHCEYCGSLIK